MAVADGIVPSWKLDPNSSLIGQRVTSRVGAHFVCKSALFPHKCGGCVRIMGQPCLASRFNMGDKKSDFYHSRWWRRVVKFNLKFTFSGVFFFKCSTVPHDECLAKKKNLIVASHMVKYHCKKKNLDSFFLWYHSVKLPGHFLSLVQCVWLIIWVLCIPHPMHDSVKQNAFSLSVHLTLNKPLVR